jgi:hypothetical protein
VRIEPRLEPHFAREIAVGEDRNDAAPDREVDRPRNFRAIAWKTGTERDSASRPAKGPSTRTKGVRNPAATKTSFAAIASFRRLSARVHVAEEVGRDRRLPELPEERRDLAA